MGGNGSATVGPTYSVPTTASSALSSPVSVAGSWASSLSVVLLGEALIVFVGFGVAVRPDRAGLLVGTTLALDSRALSVLARSLIAPLPSTCGKRRRGGASEVIVGRPQQYTKRETADGIRPLRFSLSWLRHTHRPLPRDEIIRACTDLSLEYCIL